MEHPSTFVMIVSYLLLLVPLAFHLYHDAMEIRANRSPDHLLMSITVGVGSIVLGSWSYTMTGINVWQFVFYALAIHFALFNYLLNLVRKPQEPFFYLGNGYWDRLLRKMPSLVRVAVQLAVVILGWVVYHKLHL